MANVLIVDDCKQMTVKLRQLFEQLNHKVVGEAVDGITGYAMYTKLQPDIVTMDIEMPGTDGITAVKKIVDRYPSAKIIMVSSVGSEKKVLEAIKSGAKHYVLKPIKPGKLKEVLDQVL